MQRLDESEEEEGEGEDKKCGCASCKEAYPSGYDQYRDIEEERD